ncbi:hypothetical protein Gotri_019789, partial [Gossypium trilobum]|nr:hypothetical protein [Gossypium trilobum]
GNVDSIYFEQEGATGYAVKVRGSTGYVLKSFLGFIYARFSLSIVEAFAIGEALSWLKSLTFDNIIVESDCLLVISALSRPSYDFSKSSVLLCGCLPMKNQFEHPSLCWIHQCANKATHS